MIIELVYRRLPVDPGRVQLRGAVPVAQIGERPSMDSVRAAMDHHGFVSVPAADQSGVSNEMVTYRHPPHLVSRPSPLSFPLGRNEWNAQVTPDHVISDI